MREEVNWVHWLAVKYMTDICESGTETSGFLKG